jgi:2-methylisocitrate lyase-like PEP mutase family enzyme
VLAQREKAENFRALHRGPRLLILPNAWDVPSARVFEEAGFPAVATSSAGLMVSRGYRDGEEMPRRELVAEVGRIASKLAVPLSADIVAGYGRTLREVLTTVRAVLAAGAVGINLEDRRPVAAGLFSTAEQVAKIKAIRQLGDRLDIPVVINARTDALRDESGDPSSRLQHAIERCIAYRDAGADCVYPMGLLDREAIAQLITAVNFPVNVMVRAGLPPIAELERLGARRLSFGPAASYAALGLLKRASREIMIQGTFSSLIEGAIDHEELNRLAETRERSRAEGRPAR